MKTIFKSIALIFFVFIVSSCKDTNSKANSQKCSDMRSYNIGKEEGENQKRGSQITGEVYSCDEVWSQLYPNTNKECFCKGYRG